MNLSYELQDKVARRVASAWVKRGVRSYSWEDIYQDSCQIMHESVHNFDASKGEIEGFLFSCCVKKLTHIIAKNMSPVSCRSHDDVVPKLKGTYGGGLENRPEIVDEEMDPLEAMYWKQLHACIREVQTHVENGEIAYLVITEQTEVKEARQPAKTVYAATTALRRNLARNPRLYRIAKERFIA